MFLNSPDKSFRIHFGENMLKNTQRLIGYIAFETTFKISLNLRVILNMYKAPFFVSIKKNYTKAILLAVEYIERYTALKEKNKLKITSRTDWIISFKDFEKSAEIIGNNILHSIISGTFKPEYINPIFNLNEKVISEDIFNKKKFFYIVGIKRLKISKRKNLLKSVKLFYSKYPFSLMTIYGMDGRKKRYIKSIIHKLPFNVEFTKDLTQSLKIIEKFKINSGEFNLYTQNNEKSLEKYKDDILNYIGNLNWEFKENDKKHNFDFSHPFIDIVNAISLVKSDMDTLIAENLDKENKLEAAKHAAEEANRIKSDFLRNISHEIMTPLNGIIGAVDLLKNTDDLTNRDTDLIKIIFDSSVKLSETVNNILDFANLDLNRINIDKKPFSISILLEKIVKKWSIKIIKKDIKLLLKIDKKVPDILIGDSAKLIQILQKIIENAVKFTKKGSIKIFVNKKTILSNKDSIMIEFIIADTGIGIDEKYINNIFTPFSQEDTSLGREYSGTGLGLSIVKKLVDKINGRINVSSQIDKGTELQLLIPFEYYNKKKKILSSKLKEENSSIIKILIVEDNPINQKLTSKMISKAGYKYDIVSNGKDAIKQLSHKDFDIVLMDIQMPIMNGIETTKLIRDKSSDVINHDIPIIAYTAHAMIEDRNKYIKSGMDDYLSKPFKYVELIEVIERNIVK